MHARILLKWIAAIVLLMMAVSYLGSLVAAQIVGHSGFRLALAANGAKSFGGKKLQVAIGNSQLMDGLNADQINHDRRDIKFLNLAFNGLRSADIVSVMETFYQSCGCTVERLYINAGALEDEKPGTSEVQIFMSAFNRQLLPQLLQDDPGMRFSLSYLPLLHFNNEVFHRSAYYWLLGHDDQGHGNIYNFRIPKIPARQLGGTQKKAMIDVPRLQRMVELARAGHTELIVVVPPFHPLYVENRIGFADYVAQVRAEMQNYQIPVIDHSSGIVSGYDGYADLIHMNLAGQKIYSRYFADTVIPR